jgi:alpha-D-ribose 1-methylphosphonate 5-triphosphate synthase subunit PhnI
MYVAVKGGEAAIDNAHRLMAEERRGDPATPALSLAQIEQQLGHAIDRVMNEGSVYDRELAALAIKQAQGDLVEAIFLLRAFRSTLPRFGQTLPIDTAEMEVRRRISSAFKDVPGGQILGPTYDYTHRLLDFALAAAGNPPTAASADTPVDRILPRITDVLGRDGLVEPEPADSELAPNDITRDPPSFPAPRDARLQNLARADEGFLLSMAYSTQRGYGNTHPFAGEIRMGEVTLEFVPPELGFAVEIGEVTVTECQMINQFKGADGLPPQFTRGYGLVFGAAERKAMAMALVDRSLRAGELGEHSGAPAQDIEFVLAHSDNVEASGFVQHLKLPHYVDFQSELELLRRLRAQSGAEEAAPMAAE